MQRWRAVLWRSEVQLGLLQTFGRQSVPHIWRRLLGDEVLSGKDVHEVRVRFALHDRDDVYQTGRGVRGRRKLLRRSDLPRRDVLAAAPRNGLQGDRGDVWEHADVLSVDAVLPEHGVLHSVGLGQRVVRVERRLLLGLVQGRDLSRLGDRWCMHVRRGLRSEIQLAGDGAALRSRRDLLRAAERFVLVAERLLLGLLYERHVRLLAEGRDDE